MSKQLDVYLHDSLAGQLEQDKHGRISFAYDSSWLNQPNSVPLSHSLPLRAERYQGKECQGFFAGVLPEEQNREMIASILGISARNDFALLEQIGGECAGAVTFIPTGSTLPVSKPEYRPLGEAELAEILRELPLRPLMAGSKDIRLSLAGAQNKLAVHVEEGRISLPLQNAPSTHILKPAIPRFEGLVQNEAFCMELAAQAGLATAKVSIGKCEEIEYLLAERYDRHTVEGVLSRRH
jgi:serine/threonine-protein kinase HipA